MSNIAERDPNLALLVSAGYPMAAGLMLFSAWTSFWTFPATPLMAPATDTGLPERQAERRLEPISDEMNEVVRLF
jgi:hypothetical protein